MIATRAEGWHGGAVTEGEKKGDAFAIRLSRPLFAYAKIHLPKQTPARRRVCESATERSEALSAKKGSLWAEGVVEAGFCGK